METYLNKSGRSGVTNYKLNADSIDVTFKNGKTYRYDVKDNGTQMIGEMQSLADHGLYLNRYVNKNKPTYSKSADVSKYETKVEPEIHDNRPMPPQSVLSNIFNKFKSRSKEVWDKVKETGQKALSKAKDFAEYVRIKNGTLL